MYTYISVAAGNIPLMTFCNMYGKLLFSTFCKRTVFGHRLAIIFKQIVPLQHCRKVRSPPPKKKQSALETTKTTEMRQKKSKFPSILSSVFFKKSVKSYSYIGLEKVAKKM